MDPITSGYGLIEGPVWDSERGLIFADVMNGGVRALDRQGQVTDVVPKRRGIGGMALYEDGGLVLGGREIILQPPDGADAITLLDANVTEEAIGFNDLTTDAAGAFGSVHSRFVSLLVNRHAQGTCMSLTSTAPYRRSQTM
jgi:sugar lactone lactonase YvrE